MNEKEINELETLHNKIYKETEDYGRTQFVSRIVDLEHNWNELKKWLEEEYKNCIEDANVWSMEQINRTKDKMQELEGVSNE